MPSPSTCRLNNVRGRSRGTFRERESHLTIHNTVLKNKYITESRERPFSLDYYYYVLVLHNQNPISLTHTVRDWLIELVNQSNQNIKIHLQFYLLIVSYLCKFAEDEKEGENKQQQQLRYGDCECLATRGRPPLYPKLRSPFCRLPGLLTLILLFLFFDFAMILSMLFIFYFYYLSFFLIICVTLSYLIHNLYFLGLQFLFGIIGMFIYVRD